LEAKKVTVTAAFQKMETKAQENHKKAKEAAEGLINEAEKKRDAFKKETETKVTKAKAAMADVKTKFKEGLKTRTA